MIEQLIVIVLIGTLLSIDVTLAGQLLASRPLVVLSIIGFYAGDPVSGFIIGVFLELICSDMLPLGVSVPLDTAVMSTVAGGVYFLGGSAAAVNIKSLAVFFALCSGFIFREYDLWFKRKASVIFTYVREFSEHLDKSIEFAITLNIILTLLRNFIFMIVFVSLAVFIKGVVVAYMPAPVLEGFSYFDNFLPYLGLAVLLSAVKQKRFGL